MISTSTRRSNSECPTPTRTTSRWRRIALALISGVLALGAVTTPSPAEAASYGWVYVVVDHSVCGQSGVVVRNVQGNFNWGGGSSTINWEGDGDNVIYPRVILNSKVNYQINAACFKKVSGRWIAVGYRALTGSFTAARHQQWITVR